MKFKIFLVGFGVLLIAIGAFLLGTTLHQDVVSDAEIAYRLERAGQHEVSRVKLLGDELKLRSLDSAQCIPQSAIPNIMKWAEKCVIADCSIDVGGKSFAGITVPAKPPASAPTKAAPSANVPSHAPK